MAKAKQPRWEVKPKNIPVVQRTIDGKKWWVRKPGSGGAPAGGSGTPTGGTTATTRRGDALNRLVPREWTGSAGIVGPYKREPRLNPDAYEWVQNPENNRWFARPRTELTGLPTQARADIQGFDRQTAAQQGRIQGAYDAFVGESRANAAAGQAALTALSAAAGSGYAAADPTAQVLGQAARQQSVAVAAPTVAAMGRMPDLARATGVSALEQFGLKRGEARTETIGDYREQASEAEAAKREAAADLRGQNLDLLAALGGQQTNLALGQMRAQTTQRGQTLTARSAAADRMADYSLGVQKIAQQAQEARQRGQVSRANSLDRLLAKRMELEDKRRGGRKPASNADLSRWAKRAREMWKGIPTGTKDASGNPLFTLYSYSDIVRELQAAGATPARARRIASQVTGERGSGKPLGQEVRDAVTFW